MRTTAVRDKLVAERDESSPTPFARYATPASPRTSPSRGGTCLRKTVFGSAGRFSEDLDFTLDTEEPEDDVLVRMVEAFNREHYGVTFRFEKYYKTDGDTSFGGDVPYRHAWNKAGKFRPASQPARASNVARCATAHEATGVFPVPGIRPFRKLRDARCRRNDG